MQQVNWQRFIVVLCKERWSSPLFVMMWQRFIVVLCKERWSSPLFVMMCAVLMWVKCVSVVCN